MKMTPPASRRVRSSLLGCGLIALILIGLPHSAAPQNVRERVDVSRLLAVEKVAVTDGAVTGEVINRSPHTIRDVQLFIRHTWLWDNETKPGKNDPGSSTYYMVPNEIPAGGRVAFRYKPSPLLPKVAGGNFITTVAIAGYTEIIPQTR
jgi:hypothetical protein